MRAGMMIWMVTKEIARIQTVMKAIKKAMMILRVTKTRVKRVMCALGKIQCNAG